MAGHRVRVLEKASELGYSSCGIRVPPNMSKILKKWVGSEELEKVAVLNTATPCIDSTRFVSWHATLKKLKLIIHHIDTQ